MPEGYVAVNWGPITCAHARTAFMHMASSATCCAPHCLTALSQNFLTKLISIFFWVHYKSMGHKRTWIILQRDALWQQQRVTTDRNTSPVTGTDRIWLFLHFCRSGESVCRRLFSQSRNTPHSLWDYSAADWRNLVCNDHSFLLRRVPGKAHDNGISAVVDSKPRPLCRRAQKQDSKDMCRKDRAYLWIIVANPQCNTSCYGCR